MSERLVLGLPVDQYITETAALYAANCRAEHAKGYMPLDWNWFKPEFWERELRTKGRLA